MSHRSAHLTTRWFATTHATVLRLGQVLDERLAEDVARWRDEEGQATTEYALVLLGAALVALLLVAWASSGGTAGKIGRLFDRVIDSIIKKL